MLGPSGDMALIPVLCDTKGFEIEIIGASLVTLETLGSEEASFVLPIFVSSLLYELYVQAF